MSSSQITCGPFLSSSVALTALSENLYQHKLLSEAIDIYNEYEKQIQDAIENKDDEYVDALRRQSEYYDQMFQISLYSVSNINEA
jgi:hypothetical protein